MANPSVIASSKTSSEADPAATGITITHGLTLVNNDVLYAFIGESNDGEGWASSSGGTWSVLADVGSATGDDLQIAVLRRVVTNAAGEPSTYTFQATVGGAVHVMLVILVQVRSADTTTPEDATTTTSLGSDDFTPDNVDITTSTSGALVFASHVACHATTDMAAKTGGAPSGLTLVDAIGKNKVSGVRSAFLEVAYVANTTAGAQSIGAWTGTADDATAEFGTAAVAVKPEAGSVSAVPVLMREYRARRAN